MNNERTMRVVGYARISFDPKKQSDALRGLGVERQRQLLHEWATQHGHVISEVILDNDISASSRSNKARPGWDRLLSLIASGDVDIIVCSSMDRLTRRPREMETLIDLLDKTDVKVATLAGSLDLSSTSGRMVARLLGAVAANEAENTSDRLKHRLRADVANGVPHWSNRPYGFRRNNDNSVSIVEDEAAILREGLRLRLRGDSYASIAKGLQVQCESLGLRTIAPGSIRRTLTSERNIGIRVGGGKAWDGIFTDEEHQALLDVDMHDQLLGRTSGHRTWVSGLFFCSCGRTQALTKAVSTSNGYRRHVLRCVKRPSPTQAGVMLGCGVSISLARAIRETLPLLAQAHVLSDNYDPDEGDDDDPSIATSASDLEELTEAYRSKAIGMSAYIAATKVIEQDAASALLRRGARSVRKVVSVSPSQETSWDAWFLALPAVESIRTARAICLAHDARLMVRPAGSKVRVVWGER